MDRKEAIRILERGATIPGDDVTWEQVCEAISVAIHALLPITRDQVEKVQKGEWDENYGATIASVQCSQCKRVFMEYYKDYDFCPRCGAAMTDKAVDMVMERLEAMQDEAETV